jgi:hypothetical protein
MLKTIVVALYGFKAAALVIMVGMLTAAVVSPHFLGMIFISGATILGIKITAGITFAVVSAIKAKTIQSVQWIWSTKK